MLIFSQDSSILHMPEFWLYVNPLQQGWERWEPFTARLGTLGTLYSKAGNAGNPLQQGWERWEPLTARLGMLGTLGTLYSKAGNAGNHNYPSTPLNCLGGSCQSKCPNILHVLLKYGQLTSLLTVNCTSVSTVGQSSRLEAIVLVVGDPRDALQRPAVHRGGEGFLRRS